MKSTGYARKVDGQGRIVLPKSIRNEMDMNIGDDLRFYVDGDMIVLKKYEPSCIFCDKEDEIINYRDKHMCKMCMNDLKTK